MESDRLLPDGQNEDEKPGAPWLLKYRCSKYTILATVTVAVFTDTFFYAVIIPGLPFMLRERCNVPEKDVQFWTSAILAIAGGSIVLGSPLGGWCADNLESRKTPFYFGLVVLALSPILFGVTTNVWTLIASRICFGISSAVVYTVGLALLIDSVDTDQVGEWIGTALSGATVGITITPFLGGWVYAKFKINGLLLMMVVLVVIDIILRLFMIERGEAAQWLGPSILPNNKAAHSAINNNDRTEEGGYSEQENSLEAKRKKTSPMLRLLQSGRIWADLYGIFMNFGVLNAFDGVLPIFVRQQFRWSSTEAGLMFLNVAGPTLLSPLAGKASSKFGTRPVAIAGCVLGCPALICMRLVTDNSPGHIALLCVLLIITGLALAMVMTPLAADLSFATDKIEEAEPGVFGPRGAYGQVYALFNISMASAAVVGPIIGGALREKLGWGTMSLVLGLWCLSAVVPVFLMDEGKIDAASTNEQGEDGASA